MKYIMSVTELKELKEGYNIYPILYSGVMMGLTRRQQRDYHAPMCQAPPEVKIAYTAVIGLNPEDLEEHEENGEKVEWTTFGKEGYINTWTPLMKESAKQLRYNQSCTYATFVFPWFHPKDDMIAEEAATEWKAWAEQTQHDIVVAEVQIGAHYDFDANFEGCPKLCSYTKHRPVRKRTFVDRCITQ